VSLHFNFMNPKLHYSILLLCVLGASVVQAKAQTAASGRFQQLDKNGDGKLTQEEFPYPFFFKKHDKDGDGMLSREEAAEIKAAGGKTTTTSPTAAPAAASDFNRRPRGDEATKAAVAPGEAGGPVAPFSPKRAYHSNTCATSSAHICGASSAAASYHQNLGCNGGWPRESKSISTGRRKRVYFVRAACCGCATCCCNRVQIRKNHNTRATCTATT
jgi:hypothetical protein